MSLNVHVSIDANESEKPKESNDMQLHLQKASLQNASQQLSGPESLISPCVPSSASSDHPPRSFSSLSSRTAMTPALSVHSANYSPQTGPDSADVETLRKEYLHISAERAKERKRQEEEERMKAQERAKRKAIELEKKMQLNSPVTSLSASEMSLENGMLQQPASNNAHNAGKQEVCKFVLTKFLC